MQIVTKLINLEIIVLQKEVNMAKQDFLSVICHTALLDRDVLC